MTWESEENILDRASIAVFEERIQQTMQCRRKKRKVPIAYFRRVDEIKRRCEDLVDILPPNALSSAEHYDLFRTLARLRAHTSREDAAYAFKKFKYLLYGISPIAARDKKSRKVYNAVVHEANSLRATLDPRAIYAIKNR